MSTKPDGSTGCDQSSTATVRKPRLQLQGGYECIFVNETPQHLQTECSVCLCVLKDPQLIDCDCGSSFCRDCIEPIKADGKPCPLCNGTFTTSIPDRRLHRTLNSLKVYCSYRGSGCSWVGELVKLTIHLDVPLSPSAPVPSIKGACGFVLVECGYCQEKFERRFIDDHKKEECLKRPFRCDCCGDYESTFEDVTTKHFFICSCTRVPCYNECGAYPKRKHLTKHLTKECPLEVINCSFSYAGCSERLFRKDLPTHIRESLADHMSLQATNHQRQLEKLETRVQVLEIENMSLKEEIKSEQEGATNVYYPHTQLLIIPVQFMVDKFTLRKENKEEWVSQPFYTHPHGYKMRLTVCFDGVDDGEGTHVSVFTKIECGEFDSQLDWPFQGIITITLIDQEGDEHITRTVCYDEDTPEEYKKQVKKDLEGEEWGCPRFMAHDDLYPKYLKNYFLCLKVSEKSNFEE